MIYNYESDRYSFVIWGTPKCNSLIGQENIWVSAHTDTTSQGVPKYPHTQFEIKRKRGSHLNTNPINYNKLHLAGLRNYYGAGIF
jgi:hypothetical protein